MSESWVEAWLGEPRFGKYLQCCDGDRRKALQTYEWNVVLAMSLMRDISHFEIALRNAYDRSIDTNWHGEQHWLLSSDNPIFTRLDGMSSQRTKDQDHKSRLAVSDAIARASSDDHVAPSSGKIVAELTLGFWSRFTFKINEHNLWIPFLHREFEPGITRDDVHRNVMKIHTMRNRIAHHEPVFHQPPHAKHKPDRAYDAIVETLEWFAPEVARHVKVSSSVLEILSNRP